MKRIFVPTRTGAEWQLLLAKPKLHWKKGASAMTLAAAWEAAAEVLPGEISRQLEATQEPLLRGQELVVALPEWQVPLPGGVTASSTDVLAICRNDRSLCVIAVEGKVLEHFGPLLGEKRAETSIGQSDRLAYLHSLLDVDLFDDSIRYQLVHRTASALLTARQFHASVAVMLVHAFDTPATQRGEFEYFRKALSAHEIAPLVYHAMQFQGPALFLVWCDGDPSFRNVLLPSVV
jgi:hypothetical protein